MPGGDDQGDGPVDEFECRQGGQAAVVGQLLGPRNLELPHHRHVHHEGFALADLLYRFTLRYPTACLLFRHHLPFSNEGFAASPGREVNVGPMSTTDSVADPLVSSIALVLRVPLVELYALLWRVGVVEIRHSDRTAYRSSRGRPVPVAACAPCPECPNLPQHGSERLPRRSLQRRRPAPAPNRLDPAVCSQATG